MKHASISTTFLALLLGVPVATPVHAQITLLAKGTLTGSTAGSYADLSGLPGTLENGVRANLLGGLGSGIAHVSGDTFLAVPDRGPNAVPFNSVIDDTASYIDRFHTIKMNLARNAGTGLPFVIAPQLEATTLLESSTPLVYGAGTWFHIAPGTPAQNTATQHYFTGRSDNYIPNSDSGNPNDGRLDPESIRMSPDGTTVYISDEYGPYIHEFARATGERLRTFRLPDHFYVAVPQPTTNGELAVNSVGRVPNKGMEGLALTPDGKTLVGMMQASLIQDANQGGDAANVLRFVTVDVVSGKTTHEYAYNLTTGSGVSEIVALNDHEILVDERDGKGLGDGSKAKVKQLFKINFNGATDVGDMDGLQASKNAVSKTLFLDLVDLLTANGFTSSTIPAKIEGVAFGPDVVTDAGTLHTVWIANDNDFLQDYSGTNTNPNQFFVVGFTDKDLNGSEYMPQAAL